jgi:putative transposase
MKTEVKNPKELDEKAKWTDQEKLSIIKEADLKGVRVTLDKYDLFPGTFYYWKKKIAESGEEGLKHGMTKERLNEINRLKSENEKLKKIIGDYALEAKLKDELLEKKYPTWNLKKG